MDKRRHLISNTWKQLCASDYQTEQKSFTNQLKPKTLCFDQDLESQWPDLHNQLIFRGQKKGSCGAMNTSLKCNNSAWFGYSITLPLSF